MRIRVLQQMHLFLIVVVPTLVAILRLNSSDQDAIPVILSRGTAVLATVWAGIIVAAMILGRERSSIAGSFLVGYRSLLQSRTILLATNAIMCSAALVLIDQIVNVRQVAVASTQRVTVFINDKPGVMVRIAKVPDGGDTLIRLRVGEHHIAYEMADGRREALLETIRIPPVWSKAAVPTIRITPGPVYEK